MKIYILVGNLFGIQTNIKIYDNLEEAKIKLIEKGNKYYIEEFEINGDYISKYEFIKMFGSDEKFIRTDKDGKISFI